MADEVQEMTTECWCYTTDEGYLLPTLVSASQLRKQFMGTGIDVIIVYVGPYTEIVKAAEAAAKNEGIIMIIVPRSFINDGPMIVARLYLGKVLEKAYKYITYLDGDTQVVGRVDPLVQAVPRSGSILAAPDIMAIMVGDQRRQWRDRPAYFRRIGISSENHRRYFNSGVLKTSRSDWEAISRECLDLLKKPVSNEFSFKDQDALNIILGGNQELISLRWNWPGFLLSTGAEKIVPPQIVHYMSRPRPWDGPFPPWGKSGNSCYQRFVETYPALRALYRPFTGGRYLRYQAQQLFKGLTEGYGSADVRNRIEVLEQRARI